MLPARGVTVLLVLPKSYQILKLQLLFCLLSGKEKIPIQLAHVQLNMEYADTDAHIATSGEDPFVHEAYAEHPVRMQALADGLGGGSTIFG